MKHKSATRFILILFSAHLLAASLSGQVRIVATRVKTPLHLDGLLDDQLWSEADVYSQFATLQPDIGKPATETTTYRVGYDAENIYFGIEALDSEPEKVKASVTNWDYVFNGDDFVAIIIDALHDKQSAYGFVVNGLGSQGDAQIDANFSPDLAPDFIWEGWGTMTPEGYSVEMKIPLKSLRYQAGEKVEMGLMCARFVSRQSEISIHPPVTVEKGSVLAQAATVVFENLGYQRTIEILPAFTQATVYDTSGGDLLRTAAESGADLGLTAKVGLTPTLTLDLTVNPDFSQVESDATQVGVNLRYANFFSEKRPFFLEGAGSFNLAGTGFGSAIGRIIHTRTIADPFLGAKVSGKLGPSNAVAALVALDESPTYIDNNGKAALYTVARYKRLLKDESYIGAMGISRDHAVGANRIGLLDAFFRLSGTMTVSANVIFTSLEDPAADVTSTATNVDASWTYGTRTHFFQIGYHNMSKGFQDQISTGYIPRDGIRTYTLQGSRTFYFEGPIQNVRVAFNGRNRYDLYDEKGEWMNQGVFSISLPRSTYIEAHYHDESEIFAGKRFSRSGPMAFFGSQLFKSLSLNFAWIGTGSPFYDPDDPGQADLQYQSAGFNFKPTENFTTELSASRTTLGLRESGESLFDIELLRSKTTYQLNKYLFVRTILDWDAFSKALTSEFLISFTYIPGTVIHLGYGTALQETDDYPTLPRYAGRFSENARSIFFKASYNWRK